MDKKCDVTAQREYYARTASSYDQMHVDPDDEHFFGLHVLSAMIDFTGAQSLLDIGSGTGRAVQFLKVRHPTLRIVGIEPVKELREQAYAKGLTSEELTDGEATALSFEDNSFDIVCEFGVLHHVKVDELAAAEMARVAKIGVFLSDSNNMGQGGLLSRTAKQILKAVRLWTFADWIRTGGTGYMTSEGDGIFYSYSIFDSVRVVSKKFKRCHYMNSKQSGLNLLSNASHVVVFATRNYLDNISPVSS